jgi:hypothetical protein
MTNERKAKERGLRRLVKTEEYKSTTKEEQKKQEDEFVEKNHKVYLRRYEKEKADFNKLLSQTPIHPGAIDEGDQGDELDELEVVGKAGYDSIVGKWYEEDETDETSDEDDKEVCIITRINR